MKRKEMKRKHQPSTPTWKNCLHFYFSHAENMLSSKMKGRCARYSSVATNGLCVWSSWEPISGICSLMEISLTYHLSLDFLPLPWKPEVLFGWRRGTAVLPGTRCKRKKQEVFLFVQYVQTLTWKMLPDYLEVLPSQEGNRVPWNRRSLCTSESGHSIAWGVSPFNFSEHVKSASIPLKGYRAKNIF